MKRAARWIGGGLALVAVVAGYVFFLAAVMLP